MLRARTGLTLIELVVTLVVTAMLATAGAFTFSSIIDHRDVIVNATLETERAAALREMLRNWIGSSTIMITTQGPQGRTSVTSFGPTGISRSTTAPNALASSTTSTGITAAVSTGDELTFRTSALTPAMTPDVRMRLFVDGDPATPEVGLTIEYQATTQAPLQRKQLDPDILAMTVEFFDQRTNRWYPYSEASAITPIAARVSFPAIDGLQYPPRLLQLPILVVMQQQTATTTSTGR